MTMNMEKSPMNTMQQDVLTPAATDLPVLITPRVISVKPLGAQRRTPVAIVHVVVGPLVLVLGVVRIQRKLMVRPPVADGGGSAIGAKPEVWGPIERAAIAAVRADPVALAHVMSKGYRPPAQ